MNIKKILSLIGATAITTSGAAPLMAMMPNNKSSNFSTAESSSSVTGGEDKILKDSLYRDNEKQETFIADWIIYLSSKTIKNLNKFLIDTRVPFLDIRIINMVNFLKLKLKEINDNNELIFVSKIEENSIFYSNLLATFGNIFSSPLINSINGVIFTVDDFGNLVHLFNQ
ncbi:hypothetical protein SKUN_001233 [Spiroplasma kunkelii CR2-3x]|uniref:Spiroplasmavirus-related protein n=1 Tax=Spiroplasma kunkelii CR2-3x TaxID=273035 RepID=A0A0K2JI37_SPIKU|nr:hypothetical protein [Spiroplasma kunkelii]ALA98108.1 hypothetical protein SKUN_001233 [Spiroplasma kunkelii CR2-3x]